MHSPNTFSAQSSETQTGYSHYRSLYREFHHPTDQSTQVSQRPACSSSQDQTNPSSTTAQGLSSSPDDVVNGPATTAQHQKFKCPVADCPKDYACRSSLSRHMNKHKDKTFPCRYCCGTEFTRVDNRNTHERRHSRGQYLPTLEEQPNHV